MTKFIPLSLAALATATLIAGSAVMAQPAPDRSTTRAEAQTHATEAFGRFDVNSDGQLSSADREAVARQHFDAADADNNGQLSFAEAGAMREQRREMRADRHEGRHEARGERTGMGQMRGMRGAGPMGAGGMRGQMLEGADTDNNGTVSQAEFTSAALARFDRADANSDGTVTADEHRAMRGMGQGMRQGMGRGDRHGEHRGRPAPQG